MLVRSGLIPALMLLAACASSRPAERPSSAVGQPLVLSAPDLEGREVDVAADVGRVRVVDFWATWCEPCKEAMPVLDALSRELGPRGLSVYGVSIDEDRAQVADFLARGPVGFTILWDEGAVRVSRLDVRYMPVTLIVDRRGVIRHVHQGWDAAKARQQRRQIEALLAEP
jgi:cytochrome c biogenesis protein CcmG, thiol:disulfide interchange protein DsbE